MRWIRTTGHKVLDAPESEEISEITELDELQTFIDNKRNKVWIGSAVNHWKAGILAWVVGERSSAMP